MSQWWWLIVRYLRKLWVRSTLIGALGIAAAGFAAIAEKIAPWHSLFNISNDAIDSLLTIIASSMLAVCTFSLSVMASKLASTSSSTSPSATKLLVKDKVTQNVLAAFVGSFLFSIVGLVALKAGAYSAPGRDMLFIFTIAVLSLIVVRLLQWIDHLTRFGRVDETCKHLENITAKAIKERRKAPFFGGRELLSDHPALSPAAIAVPAPRSGYVQHFDMNQLSDCTGTAQGKLYLEAMPGHYIYQGAPLARLDDITGKDVDINAVIAQIQKAFILDDDRNLEDDPGNGIWILNEIAMRALSPAVNDPGTAINVIGRQAKLLSLWAEVARDQSDHDIIHPHIFLPKVDISRYFSDAFEGIARDGAALIEVQSKLRKAFQALARIGDDEFRAAARKQAALALKRAENALKLDEEKKRLAEIRIDG